MNLAGWYSKANGTVWEPILGLGAAMLVHMMSPNYISCRTAVVCAIIIKLIYRTIATQNWKNTRIIAGKHWRRRQTGGSFPHMPLR